MPRRLLLDADLRRPTAARTRRPPQRPRTAPWPLADPPRGPSARPASAQEARRAHERGRRNDQCGPCDWISFHARSISFSDLIRCHSAPRLPRRGQRSGRNSPDDGHAELRRFPRGGRLRASWPMGILIQPGRTLDVDEGPHRGPLKVLLLLRSRYSEGWVGFLPLLTIHIARRDPAPATHPSRDAGHRPSGGGGSWDRDRGRPSTPAGTAARILKENAAARRRRFPGLRRTRPCSILGT